MLTTYLTIFLGGGLGSILRFTISSLISHNTNENFPWSTLSVNLLGAFLIGIIVELLALRYSTPTNLRYLLVTGFLGGFTTFSAFSLESALMWTKGNYLPLTAYILSSVIGTIILVLTAMFLTKLLINSTIS